MSFWSKVGEQASERIRLSREQLSATIQQRTAPKPSDQEANKSTDEKDAERSHSEAHTFFDDGYEAKMSAAKQLQVQQSREKSELARLQQANKLLEAKIEMLRANLEAARASKPEGADGDEADPLALQLELSKAHQKVGLLQETSNLLKQQQAEAVQAAATSQKQIKHFQLELAGAKNQVAELNKVLGQSRADLRRAKDAAALKADTEQQQDGLAAATKLAAEAKAELEAQLKAVSAERQELWKRVTEAETQNAALQSRLAAEADQGKTQEQRIELLTQQNQELSGLTVTVDELRREIKQLKGTVSEQDAALKEAADAADTEIRSRLGREDGGGLEAVSIGMVNGSSFSPQDSPRRILRGLASNSQPDSPASTESLAAKDADALAAEVKRLRAQLQMATEKWARDKQMFAQDARELQRVSRVKDQLGSQVAKLKAQAEVHQDMTDELNGARQALEAKTVELQDTQLIANEHQKLRAILADWKLQDEASKKADSGEDLNLAEQLMARQAAATALHEELAGVSEAAAASKKALGGVELQLKALHAELAKEKEEKAQLQQKTSETAGIYDRLAAEQKEVSREAADLKSAVESLRTQNLQLSEQHSAAQRELEAAQKASSSGVQSAEAAAQEAQEEIRELQGHVQHLLEERRGDKGRNSQLAETIGELESQLASLRAEAEERIEGARLQSFQIEGREDKLRTENSQLTAQVHSLEASLQEAAVQHDSALKDYRQQAETLSEALRESKAQADSRDVRSSEIDLLRAELQGARLEAEQRESVLLLSQTELEAAKMEALRDREALKEAQQQGDELKALQEQLQTVQGHAAASEQRAEERGASAALLREQGNTDREQIKSLEINAQQLQSELQSVKAEAAEMEKQLSAQNAALHEKVEAAEKQLQREAEAASLQAQETSQLRQELDGSAALVSKLEAELKSTQAELERTTTSHTDRIASLESQLQRATSQRTTSAEAELLQMQKVQHELQEAQHRLHATGAELENSRQREQELQHQAEGSKADLERALEELQQAKTDRDEARSTLERLEEEQRLLNDRLSRSTSHAAAAEKEIQELKKELQNLQLGSQESTEVRKRLEEVELKKEDLDRAAQKAVEERNLAETRASATEKQVVVLTQQLEAAAGLQSQLESAEAATRSLEEQLQKARADSEGLDSRIAKLNAQAEAGKGASEALQRKEAEIGELKVQLQTLQAQIQSSTASAEDNLKLKESLEAEAAQLRKDADALSLKLQAAEVQLQQKMESATANLTALKEAESKAQKAAQRASDLEQEKSMLQEQVQSLDKTWQGERAGLKEKLERLQKANRQWRQDTEALQTELLSAQDLAAKGQQARDQLLEAQQRAQELSGRLAAAEGASSAVKGLEAKLRAAEEGHSASTSAARREASELISSLDAVSRERDSLQQEVMLLKSASVAKDALQSQTATLTRDLEAARESLLEAQRRARKGEEVEKKLQEAQADAASAYSLVATSQQKQQAAEQQLEATAELLEEERRRRAADALTAAADLDSLASRAEASWPESLRSLLEQREAAAAEAASASAQAEADVIEERLESQVQAANREAQSSAEALQVVSVARDAAEQRVSNLEAELQEREIAFTASLEARLQRERVSAEARQQSLEERAISSEKAVANSEAALDEARSALEASIKELAEVKQRARALLEEKDAQLQAAKLRTLSRMDSLSGDVSSPLPVSRGAVDLLSPRSLEDHSRVASPRSQTLVLESMPSSSGPMSPTSPELRGSEIEPAAEPAGSKPPQRNTRLQALAERVTMLEKELVDSEHTHRLRDRAQEVAKAEIAELQRSKAREGLDVDYLKVVLLKGFESGELPGSSSMLPIIARLLHFSTEELQRAEASKKALKAPAKK